MANWNAEISTADQFALHEYSISYEISYDDDNDDDDDDEDEQGLGYGRTGTGMIVIVCRKFLVQLLVGELRIFIQR